MKKTTNTLPAAAANAKAKRDAVKAAKVQAALDALKAAEVAAEEVKGNDVVSALTEVVPAAEVVPVVIPKGTVNGVNLFDRTDKGIEASLAFLTEKVVAGKVICKAGLNGKPTAFLTATENEAKAGKATVNATYYPNKVRNGIVGHWAYCFIKTRGKKGGQQRQDYWFDVLLQYVSIND